MIMIHGRNAGPENILELAGPLRHPGFTFLAPAAAGGTWYPFSFLAETERNEPGLSSGLEAIDHLIHTIEEAGIPKHRIILLGFSQGACLSSGVCSSVVRSRIHFSSLLETSSPTRTLPASSKRSQC